MPTLIPTMTTAHVPTLHAENLGSYRVSLAGNVGTPTQLLK